MPAKQDRYRQRKEEQGFQRVEVIVPSETAAYLKAYARALRDAHQLGLEPPLFAGLHRAAEIAISSELPETPLDREPPQGRSDHVALKPTAPPVKKRPDFSKGLLDD